MSARDSAGPAGPGGGGGGLANGGIGGGFGGGAAGGQGGMGAGAGYNGGYNSHTGLTTGKDMYGNTAYGRSGGMVQAYGMRDAASLRNAGMGPTMGSYGNFRTPSGKAMFGGSPVQGMSFQGNNMGQALGRAQSLAETMASMHQPGVHAQPAGFTSPTYSPPPTFAPPPKLTKAMLPGFFGSVPPSYPPIYEVPDDILPVQGYTPPASAFLPGPKPPASGGTMASWPGQNSYYDAGETGKVYDGPNDRVPRSEGFAQSGSTTQTRRR